MRVELGNEEYSYYDYTLPVCMVLFSDRVWNSNVSEFDDEYIRAISEMIIGRKLSECNPLCVFEDIIPPRKKNVLESLNMDKIDIKELSQIISKLKEIKTANFNSKLQ